MYKTYLITYTVGLGKFNLKTLKAESPGNAVRIFSEWKETPQAHTRGEQDAYIESIHEVGPLVYGQE